MIFRLLKGKLFLFLPFFCVFLAAPLFALQEFYIVSGDSKVLYSGQDVVGLAVDNPAIADINVLDEDVIVKGKDAGQTIISIDLDDGRVLKYKVVVWRKNINLVANKLNSVIEALGISKKVTVKKDMDIGLVYLVGSVFTDKEMNDVEQAISACGDDADVVVNLVKKAEVEDSVRLSVNILEISNTLMKNLGIQWPQQVNFSTEEISTGKNSVASLGDTLHLNVWDRSELSIVLNALENENNGRILARPNIMAASGEEAQIVVGGEIPIVKYDGESAGVEFKPYGIVLKVTPTIIRDAVQLSVKTEISEIDSANGTTVTLASDKTQVVYSVPAFLSRKASTIVNMKDRDTLIMAGLLKQKNTKVISRIPGIFRLPIIGELFKSKDFTDNKTELVITITPEVVKLHKDNIGREDSKEIMLLSKKESQKMLPQTLEDYKQWIKSKIKEKLSSIDLKQKIDHGTVILSIHVERNGNVSSTRIKQSSGNKVLDRMAVMIIRDIQPLLPLPVDINVDNVWIDIPIVFR